MTSRVGLSYQLGTDVSTLRAQVGSAPWAAVKSVDDLRPLLVAREFGVPTRVLRLFGLESLDVEAAWDRIVGFTLDAVTHLQLVCENPRAWDEDWQLELGRRLSNRGVRPLFYGFSTGNPTQLEVVPTHVGPHFPEWLRLQKSLDWLRLYGAMALNQYFYVPSDSPDWPKQLYTASRDVLVRSCLAQHSLPDLRVVVTESGKEPGGWRGVLTPEQYLASIVALDAKDETDDGLLGRCYFTLTPNTQWTSYDYESLLSQLADYVRSRATVPTPVAHRVPYVIGGHPMPPVEPIDYKQDAGSADCWDEEVRRFFSRYGVLVDLDLPYQVAKGKPRPVGGEPATFDELVAAVRGIASHSNVNVDSTTVPYLQVLTLNDAAHVSAALDDPDPANKWTVIAGVNGRTLGLTNADGSPASWGHFVTLVRWADASKARVVVADPASRWDSDSTQVYDWSALVAAMEGPTGNWDPVRDAVAFKIVQ